MNDRITEKEVEGLLEKLKDPNEARKFLMSAGLIDEFGNLTKPYAKNNDL